MVRAPFLMVNRLDIVRRRSDDFLTGRNRLRGTLIPVGREHIISLYTHTLCTLNENMPY